MISTVEEANQFLHKQCCQHLLAIACIYRRVDEEGSSVGDWEISISSGFLLCKGDDWYFATAGHCLKELQKLCKRNDIEYYDPFFADSFGWQLKNEVGVTFKIEDRDVEYIDDDHKGIDLGLLRLNHLEVLAFQRSNRIPLTEDKWMANPMGEFHRHLLAGTPREGASVTVINGQPAASLKPTTFPLQPIDAEPVMIVPEIPWMSFQIPDSVPLKNIEGMSGGPIFAVRQEGTQVRYWIVALQSQWNERTRIAFACRLPEFSRIFQIIEDRKR